METRSLKATIAEVLEIDPELIDDEAGINMTENWDSLNQYMIMTAIERDFDAKLAFDDMEKVSTFRAIRELLESQGIAVGD